MILRAILRRALRLRRSPPRVLVLCAAAVCAMGVVDLTTAFGAILGVFYLPPILIALGSCGRRAGVLLCLLSAAFWFWDASRLHGRPGASYSQMSERLVLFLGVIVLVDVMLARSKRSGQLLARERRTSKHKSEMLALVSHELNNSMTMIGMAVRELETGGRRPADREEVYGILKRNVSRMGILARNFLSEARLASGHMKLGAATERLAEIVAGSVEPLRLLAEDKRIDLSWSVEPPDLEASVDRVAMGVALTNLVGNAIKYTPDRGRVAVAVRLSEGPPREARVSVEDNGIGIAPEDRARVLAAFERTETGQRKAAGFGLGLKIAYDIVKAHGGSLSIESEPGKGSTFSFSLPA